MPHPLTAGLLLASSVARTPRERAEELLAADRAFAAAAAGTDLVAE